ncbi:MAG: hypothetical protein HY273_04425 [Gammaproteobacteria bacterium]|nr:hypothetical protein [Gammaproteobacteria bacterium]
MSLMCGAANAAQWTLTPQVGLSADYQDNPQLLLKNAQAVGVASVDARAELAVDSDSTQFSATPHVHAVRYPDYAELDNDSQGLALSYHHEGEHTAWSIAGDSARDSTLTTEREDTGFVQAHKWRNSSNVNPTWSREWSDGWFGKVSAGYSDVAYEKANATLLADYSYKNIDVGVSWESSERTQWGASLTAARLDAPVYRNISDNFGVQVSFAYVWSDTKRLNVSGGARYNDLRRASGMQQRTHEQTRGWTLDTAYNAESELNTWHMQASRSVDPSGVGVLVQKDKLAFALGRALTEQVNGSVNLTALQIEELQRAKISTRRQYATASVQLSWAWAPTWTVSAAYGYTQQHYQGVNGTPQASNVQFTLAWQGEPKNIKSTNGSLRSEDNGTEY